jgi:putative endonuclease
MKHASITTKTIGNEGELLVAVWLINQGFTLLARNFSAAQGENVVAFIEVKTRQSIHFPLSQVVTPSKQLKIIKTAKMYLMRNQFVDSIYRFDVALVNKEQGSLEYIENAFQGA